MALILILVFPKLFGLFLRENVEEAFSFDEGWHEFLQNHLVAKLLVGLLNQYLWNLAPSGHSLKQRLPYYFNRPRYRVRLAQATPAGLSSYFSTDCAAIHSLELTIEVLLVRLHCEVCVSQLLKILHFLQVGLLARVLLRLLQELLLVLPIVILAYMRTLEFFSEVVQNIYWALVRFLGAMRQVTFVLDNLGGRSWNHVEDVRVKPRNRELRLLVTLWNSRVRDLE